MIPRALRVGIVGVGPKGLHALEELLHGLQALDAPQAILHLFEPHPSPGAGPVYDPDQPVHLRMNSRDALLDGWMTRPELDPPGPTFTEWAADVCSEKLSGDGFSPRALVGRYLADRFERAVSRTPRTVALRMHRSPVQHLRRLGRRWVAGGTFGEVALDEVLLATGHDSRSAGRRPPPHPSVVRKVYPVRDWLGEARIPPGSVVAIRGFGLTALDVMLTLGREERTSVPRLMLPYSRTGRPMLPKLDRDALDDAEPLLDWVREAADERLDNAQDLDALMAELTALAGEALARQRAIEVEEATAACRAHLNHLLAWSPSGGNGEPPALVLAQGLAEARGERPWGLARVLGETWRSTFPKLVEVVGRGHLTRDDYARLRTVAGEMERLAFGPPAVAVAELLEMVRSGLVDLRMLKAPEVHFGPRGVLLCSEDRSVRADRLVDAVLDPPGAFPDPSPLLRRLLAEGHIRIEAGTHGVEIRQDGSAVGREGRVTPGLAVIGRPTEGRILGHDTLSRQLHDHPRRWAARITNEVAAKLEVPT